MSGLQTVADLGYLRPMGYRDFGGPKSIREARRGKKLSFFFCYFGSIFMHFCLHFTIKVQIQSMVGCHIHTRQQNRPPASAIGARGRQAGTAHTFPLQCSTESDWTHWSHFYPKALEYVITPGRTPMGLPGGLPAFFFWPPQLEANGLQPTLALL